MIGTVASTDKNSGEENEWRGIEDDVTNEVPFFGEPEEGETQQTAEEIETARVAAEQLSAAAGKTPEEIEAERVVAEQAAAAAAAKTPEEIKADELLAQKEQIRKEMLEERGFTSVDEDKKLKNPDKPETDEEKARRIEIQEADFLKFAVEGQKLTLAEINSFKHLSALPVQDVVYNDFANEFKELHKDRKGDDGAADPVTDDELREAFEEAYHTTSENPAIKAAGERAIKARAKELLGTTEGKYTAAKEEYDGYVARKAKIPEYKAMVQSALKEAIPQKFTHTVDGREFSVELDGTDFTDIENKLKNDNVFSQFFNGTDQQGLRTSIIADAKRQIAEKYLAKIAEVANRTGYDAGVKAGKVGARAPFVEEGKGSPPAPQSDKLTPAERENIRTGLGKFR
jgi:hypothetical protein